MRSTRTRRILFVFVAERGRCMPTADRAHAKKSNPLAFLTHRISRHSSFLPPNFLRPVIGTFSAEGIGRDTSDTSYKDRAISLSRQQAMNDAARGFAAR